MGAGAITSAALLATARSLIHNRRIVRFSRGNLDERGAALVEFALILPVFMMLLLGLISGGQDYNHKLDLTHAVREGARYGSTLPSSTPLGSFTSGTCAGATWANVVQSTVVARSGGSLACDQVCVALVTGS